MIAHLNIKANGKDLVLPENFSIDIEDANPLFNDNEMYTFPVSIPMDGNRHLVKDMEAINSDVRAIDVEHTPMQIIVDGVPYRSGVAVVDEAQEIADHFSFSIQSMRESLEDKISDLNCRDIPVKDKIKIGEMIGDVNVVLWANYHVHAEFEEFPFGWGGSSWNPRIYDWAEPVSRIFSLQALGFSYPFEAKVINNEKYVASRDENGHIEKNQDFINVSNAYDASHPYCNTRVCYKGLKKKKDGSTADVVDMNTKYAPYTVLEANRPQSGINFYVLYFLECLFHYLKLHYDISDLEKVEDMKRLFFFNTACKYYTERKYHQGDLVNDADLYSIEDINEWIRSRSLDPMHCGKLEVVVQKKDDIDSITIDGKTLVKGVTRKNDIFSQIHVRTLTMNKCYSKIVDSKSEVTAKIMNMFANSENFPKESVSTVLESLRNSFGIRFLVNSENHAVKAVFMRDIYRSEEEPLLFPCHVISVRKITEKCTGVRMTYSAESDRKEQRDNVKYGVRDYDTNFDYIDYRNVDRSLSYGSIIQKRSSYDMTTYVDQNTGNAYRLKVDSEAKTLSEMNARLFEVGGYKGLEYGDCSSINEDFVENLVIDWSPMLFTDINIRNEMGVGQDQPSYFWPEGQDEYVTIGYSNPASREQIFAAYFDEEMLESHATVNIDLPMPIDPIDAVLREVLTTDESYDPESTDDGNSPLQSADWGCAVGIMRGGGSDMTLQTYDYDYDGFGNSKWRFVAGSYDSSSDSIDNWGTRYDYDTSEIPGLGGEQFSLKIRAYKNDPETGAPMLYPGVSAEVKNRGLFDTFMSEHAHFLLNRKKYKIVCECEIAALADIPNHWDRRYQIGDIVGWINHISTNVSAKEGLGLVEIEMYSI